MANKFRGEVTIRLDQTRTLRFTLQSWVAYKKRFGKTIQETLEGKTLLNFDIEDLLNLLWAALLHENPNLTPEEILPLLDAAEGDCCDDQHKYIAKKVVQAYAHTQPAPLKKTMLKTVADFEQGMANLLEKLQEPTTTKEKSGGPKSVESVSATSACVPASSGT